MRKAHESRGSMKDAGNKGEKNEDQKVEVEANFQEMVQIVTQKP